MANLFHLVFISSLTIFPGFSTLTTPHGIGSIVPVMISTIGCFTSRRAAHPCFIPSVRSKTSLRTRQAMCWQFNRSIFALHFRTCTDVPISAYTIVAAITIWNVCIIFIIFTVPITRFAKLPQFTHAKLIGSILMTILVFILGLHQKGFWSSPYLVKEGLAEEGSNKI